MADVQKENGYTSIANELLQAILVAPLSQIQISVLFTIIRFTYGYQKKEANLSVNFISDFLRKDKANISKALKYLLDSSVIKILSDSRGPQSRLISLNKNYDEWEFKVTLRVVESTSLRVGNLTTPTVVNSTPAELSDHQPLELSEKQPIKETDKENNKETVLAAEGINMHNNLQPNSCLLAAQIRQPDFSGELEKKLLSLFISCLQFSPNIFELDEVKKEILTDMRFTKEESFKIVQDSFHRVAIYDRSKRNTAYTLGVIKSKKLELYQKRERERKEREKLEMQKRLHEKKSEYVPGTFMNMFNEEIAKNKKGTKPPDIK